MEIQQVDAHVSLLSRMNAFYGIPNLSPETTAAVQQGAPAPEVYSPEDNQLPQATEDTNGKTNNPIESFFTEATEQVEISDQAVALQRQNQATQADSAAPQATGETQPESTTTIPVYSPNSGPASVTGNNNEPTTSVLNAETPAPLDSNRANTTQPANGDNGQSGQATNASIATGAGYSSNAVQPGALFSALG